MNAQELFDKSKKYVPGGVHSPVRSFKGLEIPPCFFEKGEGAYLTDHEGKTYIDFCMSFGPLILGHQNPDVREALQNALARGWSFGTCETYSLELVEFLVEKLPFIEQMRFVNSGTEAVMTALRLARGITGRDKVLKFNGCYHGHVDSMLIKAGSGLAGTAEASSSGIPQGVADDTLIVDLDDLPAVQACFDEHKNQIAAIIIEPLPANNGLLIPDKNYLQGLRDICDKENALLIFDEVISGFRVAFGGMSEVTGIKADLYTYGKIIGGGMPVGAVAGSKSHMEYLAPLGNVYQAGTLSANPLAMVGGLCTLKQLDEPFYAKLKDQTEKIVSLMHRWFDEKQGKRVSIPHTTGLFWISPTAKQLKSLADIPENLSTEFNQFFPEMLEKGVYLAPNAYEVGFIGMAHDAELFGELERRLWS